MELKPGDLLYFPATSGATWNPPTLWVPPLDPSLDEYIVLVIKVDEYYVYAYTNNGDRIYHLNFLTRSILDNHIKKLT